MSETAPGAIMRRLHDFSIPYEKDPDLKTIIAKHFNIPTSQISAIRVIKRSLDARQHHQLRWVYALEVFENGEPTDAPLPSFAQHQWQDAPPLILGAGPAGLFAAWTFLAHGIKPILIERGARTHERMRKISRFWRTGELDRDSNVCYGEGGAGTFSDGKLITRIKSPLIAHVMQALVTYGAPPEITYVNNPHVGSNLIRNVIRNMSDDLIQRGANLRFDTRAEALDLSGRAVQGLKLADGNTVTSTGVILACGHSAGDFFHTLHSQGVTIAPKSFALGLRIEHKQEDINRWQYGSEAATCDLGAAQYKLASRWDEKDVSTYSFCMCPGGYVVSSSTEPDATVVNGMSNYHRNSRFANAAIVCSVDQGRIPGEDVFKMLNFQRGIEKNVFAASAEAGPAHRIPAQRLDDFLQNQRGTIPAKSSCPSGIVSANLADLLPAWIYQALCHGLHDFEKKRPGFLKPDAILHAVESRTSSPIRIPRDPETLESINTTDLFPCGEGPGYAGGITSAAVDGMRAALAWIRKFT